MKKVTTLFISTMILGSLCSAGEVFAFETEGINNTDAKSFGTVQLLAGEEKEDTEIEIPEDEDGKGGETGNTDRLAITYVSPLDFGSFNLNGKETIISAKNKAPNIQVRDIRGTAGGWTVQVSRTEFVSEDNKTLAGAKLYIPAGTVTSRTETTSGAPVASAVLVDTKAATILDAEVGAGAGAWKNTFGEGEVKLTIPQDALLGDYTAELNWAMTNTPRPE